MEKTAKQNSDTFFLPSVTERNTLKVGASVRLHFLLENPADEEPRAERMWVTVTQEHSLFRPYKGTLDNQPVYIENLAPGDEISFKPCHVAQTLIKKTDPG